RRHARGQLTRERRALGLGAELLGDTADTARHLAEARHRRVEVAPHRRRLVVALEPDGAAPLFGATRPQIDQELDEPARAPDGAEVVLRDQLLDILVAGGERL